MGLNLYRNNVIRVDSMDGTAQRERTRGTNVERGVIQRFHPLLVVRRDGLDTFHLVRSHYTSLTTFPKIVDY